ncbi:MAG: hypothetical protein JNG89_14520 [Planctomycetaceae bacterium]|nr:hypothetical protein [Planctomycetaceae bacterium]
MRTSPRPSARPPRPSVAQPAPEGSDARSVAFETLVAIEERPVFVRVVLDDLCQALGVSPRDRALALEIAAGVTRRRATLDAVLAPHIRTPEGRIEPRLRTVLRMGAYQLLFLAVPPHAAVFEMVELARRRQPRWTRFVNGVLRSVQRDLTETSAPVPGAHGVPVCDLSNRAGEVHLAYRQFRSPLFPAPESDFRGYVAAAFSLPTWLVDRWSTRYSPEQLLQLAAWFATPGRMSLRINSLRTSTAEVLQRLNEHGVAALAGAHEGAIQLLESARVESLPGFTDGQFSVQDESAIAATALLDPQPGQRVLDLCAAPGGKSAALAERMQNRGQIIAADSDAARVALIAPGAARLGLTIIEPVVVRLDGSDIPAGPFDRILLDAPCSNTGVLGKRPEARWRISESGIAELASIQASLLRSAMDRLAPGGRLVYSTCSVEPTENEDVVRRILAEWPEIQLLSERTHHPGQPGDGGYQALMAQGR